MHLANDAIETRHGPVQRRSFFTNVRVHTPEEDTVLLGEADAQRTDGSGMQRAYIISDPQFTTAVPHIGHHLRSADADAVLQHIHRVEVEQAQLHPCCPLLPHRDGEHTGRIAVFETTRSVGESHTRCIASIQPQPWTEQLVELFEIERLGLDRTDANTQDDDQQ